MPLVINLILSILIPLGAGYGCLSLLFRGQTLSVSLRVALAYGLGLGLLAIWMLGLYIFYQPFSLLILRTPLLVIIIAAFLLSFLRKKPVNMDHENIFIRTKKYTPEPGIEKVLHIALVTVLLLYLAQTAWFVVWRSMTVPILSWDAVATVAFKAKIFYFEESPPLLTLLPHRTYPLFTPFMESWVAFNLGQWNDLLIKIIFPCAFLSFLTIYYKFLGHFTNRTWAILGSVILLSSNFFIYHATISYRDFFLMYFNCITIMLLLFFNENRVSAFLILAGLFAGFASFTKLEGTAFLGVYLVLFALINFSSKLFSKKEKLINTIKFCVPSIGMAVLFHAYKIWHNVLSEGSGTSAKTNFELTWEKISLIP
ncbi:MAG: glycosyltransferase family 39 protein, partial [Candidatus Omnitrophica bacterium]|nr:glycosyltransferase family 39 protein [Candidatus Omnitrophota bacterium]